VDSADNILLTGSFIGTVNFGGPASLSSVNGGCDAFLAGHRERRLHWAQRLGGASFTEPEKQPLSPTAAAMSPSPGGFRARWTSAMVP
jgi:hypothetical protein